MTERQVITKRPKNHEKIEKKIRKIETKIEKMDKIKKIVQKNHKKIEKKTIITRMVRIFLGGVKNDGAAVAGEPLRTLKARNCVPN